MVYHIVYFLDIQGSNSSDSRQTLSTNIEYWFVSDKNIVSISSDTSNRKSISGIVVDGIVVDLVVAYFKIVLLTIPS